MIVSCLEGKSNSREVPEKEADVINSEAGKNENIDIQSIKEKLCEAFPKELVLAYNPDATHIDIETLDNGAGGILHCNVKLFYGKKEYEFWKGQVTAWVAKQKNPFWQYNPERNPALYHKVEDFGEQAVFITNTYQLLILKEGIVYEIVPPNRGRTTSTGKENKEIALEIATHYKI